MLASMANETDLYAPVKAFLEGQGYVVKGEVGGCDVLAVRDDEPPVVVELKQRFTLALVLQGIDRLAVTDAVYLAVPAPGRRASFPDPRGGDVRKLCRRLGLGLLLVDQARPPTRQVEVVLDPAPYTPRKDKPRLSRLLGEHARRAGDPNTGGSCRTPIVTAYRQDCLRLARMLADGEPRRLADLRAEGAPEDAGPLLQRDVYGWFERVARATYRLTDAGRKALADFAHALDDRADGRGDAPAPPHRESTGKADGRCGDGAA